MLIDITDILCKFQRGYSIQLLHYTYTHPLFTHPLFTPPHVYSLQFAAVRCSAVLLSTIFVNWMQLDTKDLNLPASQWLAFLSWIYYCSLHDEEELASTCTTIRIYAYMLRQYRETSTRAELNFMAVTCLLWDIRARVISPSSAIIVFTPRLGVYEGPRTSLQHN